MKVLVSLNDYERVLNNVCSHSLRKLILNVLKNKCNDINFLKNAKCNLLASKRSQIIRKKLADLENILKFLEKVITRGSIHYALIKVQPFITHLWNDVDLLVPPKDIPKITSMIKSYFGNVTATDRPLRKAMTLYVEKLSLRLDIYTTVGWGGLSAIKVDCDTVLNNFMRNSITCREISYEVQMLRPELDLPIQLMHIYASELALTLTDFIKILLSLDLNFSPFEEFFVASPRRLLQLSFRASLEKLEELLTVGRINTPLQETGAVALRIFLENLKSGNTNLRGYYYEIEHLVLYITSLLRKSLP